MSKLVAFWIHLKLPACEDTLIVLTADHGFQLGEHGLWFKNFTYKESCHILMIIADPRFPQTHDQQSDALIDQTDIFPTILIALGNPTCIRNLMVQV